MDFKPENASVIILTVGLVAAFGFNPMIGALPTEPAPDGENSGHGFYLLLFRLVLLHCLHSARHIFLIKEN